MLRFVVKFGEKDETYFAIDFLERCVIKSQFNSTKIRIKQ
jgi:hypothetical protein